MKTHMDSSLSARERAEILLGKMTLEEKMSQVVCIMPYSLQIEDCIQKAELAAPAGVGHISCLVMREHTTLEQAVQWQRAMQERIMECSPNHIPAAFHMEGLCGAYLPQAASFPSGYARGASWNPLLEQEIGEIVGRQERAAGISQTLAPVLDISRDMRMGRCAESYGEDPTLAAALGCAFLSGLQRQTEGLHTQGVAKHFLGFHASEGGIHGTACAVPPRQLREVYGKPFQAAIARENLRGIMPCYNPVNGVPASVSKEILQDLLRKEMGYEGVCVSDYCAIKNLHHAQGMFESDAEAGFAAMAAGMDAEFHYACCFGSELMEQFRSREADISVLDRAVLHILENKFRMGLFEHPFASGKDFAHGNETKVSLQSAREAMVLLKNDGLLPIEDKPQKIAVIGCFAEDPRFQFGGYTHFSMVEGALAPVVTMAGLESESDSSEEDHVIPGTRIFSSEAPRYQQVLARQKPGMRSLLAELRQRLPKAELTYSYGYSFAGTDESDHAQALRAAEQADLVLVTLGGKYGTSVIASMGEGLDGTSINLPPCQERFLDKLAVLHKPVVAVHFDGRPISSDAAEHCCGAILEGWTCAEGGCTAAAEILTGAYNPEGKLPVSVAYSVGQIPVYYNHYHNCSYHKRSGMTQTAYVDCSHEPRYFFGYGLSYTEFQYRNLRMDKTVLKPGENLNIQLEVTNIGNCPGAEVVQLYVSDDYASILRPVCELAGFYKVCLLPGQTKTICFALPHSQLAFLNSEMQWCVEKGTFSLRIGASSEDIRLQGSFRTDCTVPVDGKTRGFWAKAAE